MEKSNKHGAGAQNAKTPGSNPGKTALSDYETTAEALRAKTERLKALRLARDAANPPQPPAVSRRRAKSKAAPGALSDWLDAQTKEGRRT